jgi:hypothetical protein
VPAAVTEKVAVCPAITVAAAGCVVMDGGPLTVRIAAVLVTLPVVLVTVTVKDEPLSDATAAGVVYEAEVAPLIAVPFFFHW